MYHLLSHLVPAVISTIINVIVVSQLNRTVTERILVALLAYTGIECLLNDNYKCYYWQQERNKAV